MDALRGIVAVTLAVLFAAAPVYAQGKGRPKRPARTAPAGGGAAAPAVAEQGAPATPAFRQFGVWLDDASSPAAGHGRFGIGAGYWRVDGGSLVDLPILDLAYGVTDRVQLSATVPFYRSTFAGFTSRGVDDVYLSAKVLAIDPATSASGFGIAVSPVIEILSPGFSDDRVHWALPASAELRIAPFRIYGAAGYFSRGSVFGGGAVEWTAASGTLVSGALTQSLSTVGDAVASARTRADVSLTVGHPLSDAIAAYAGVGRSLRSAREGGTSLAISGGIAVSFGSATSAP